MVADFVDSLPVLENLFLFALLQGTAYFEWLGLHGKLTD